MAGIPLSSHLLARKPIATSSAAKKSSKQRKRENDQGGENDGPDFMSPPPLTPQAKALEYQLIDLMSEPDIDDAVKQSIWSLVQYLTARKAKKQSEANE
jgi:hypothetical protein